MCLHCMGPLLYTVQHHTCLYSHDFLFFFSLLLLVCRTGMLPLSTALVRKDLWGQFRRPGVSFHACPFQAGSPVLTPRGLCSVTCAWIVDGGQGVSYSTIELEIAERTTYTSATLPRVPCPVCLLFVVLTTLWHVTDLFSHCLFHPPRKTKPCGWGQTPDVFCPSLCHQRLCQSMSETTWGSRWMFLEWISY